MPGGIHGVLCAVRAPVLSGGVAAANGVGTGGDRLRDPSAKSNAKNGCHWLPGGHVQYPMSLTRIKWTGEFRTGKSHGVVDIR